MPILINSSPKSGRDPFFDSSCEEFHSLVQAAKKRALFHNSWYAEHLCESARSLIYQYPRVTLEQSQRLIELFVEALAAIVEGKYERAEDQCSANVYAQHIQARIDNLSAPRSVEDLLRQSCSEAFAEIQR